MKDRLGGRARRLALVENSPLRPLDPRVKLAMSLCASLAVMLPLQQLIIFLAGFILFLTWARLLPNAARQAWRMKWLLLFLFVMDAWLIDLELAVAVTLRLLLLAATFTLVFATTTPSEFSLALESLRLPYRYAFSLGLAFQSLNLLDEEWRSIFEAQHARGILRYDSKQSPAWRRILEQVRDLVALTVPAIVLTTKRAWSITEAAYARGFDTPHRQPYRQLRMAWRDWLALAATAALGVLLLWR
jgi:energy-coupling factor transporter transmembrane protein EcfT